MCTRWNLELYLYLSLFCLRNCKSSGILCMGLLQSHNEVKVVSPQKMIFSQKGSRNQCRFLYFCERIEYWYSGQIECFWKPFLNHFLNVFASMHLVNVLITPFLHVFYYQCSESYVVNSVVKLHYCLFFLWSYSWWLLLYLCLLFWGFRQIQLWNLSHSCLELKDAYWQCHHI